VQHLNVLKEFHKLIFDFGLLGKFFNVKVGGILDATFEKIELRSLLFSKSWLVDKLNQKEGTVETLSKSF
jgi:hypothetical protein